MSEHIENVEVIEKIAKEVMQSKSQKEIETIVYTFAYGLLM
ncbi:MAG: hypothetical protein ACOWWR_16890 [Eubacteriales bacterium]